MSAVKAAALVRDRRAWAWLFLVAALATAVMIFCFSAQQAEDSQALSDGVTLEVAKVVRADFPRLPAAERASLLTTLGRIVRKCAHFLEFALLGFNLTCWLRLRSASVRPLGAAVPGWGIATLYAATDELHQAFVAGRGPGIVDVGIDSGGALTGALAATLVLWIAFGILAKMEKKRKI